MTFRHVLIAFAAISFATLAVPLGQSCTGSTETQRDQVDSRGGVDLRPADGDGVRRDVPGCHR
jgi:hypothetical protein